MNRTIKEAERLHVMKEVRSKRITLTKASKLMGISLRQARRIWRRYEVEGATGLTSRRLGLTPGNKIPKNLQTRIISLVKEKYYDFGPTFAREKLLECHDINVSKEWLRKLMIEEGIWETKKVKKAKIFRRRARRSRYGELVQIDGSYHTWFEERGPKCCLLVAVDDATGKLLGLRFCNH